jgi:septal ring factor EnvC (AmiA/AmiB activator)
MADAGATNPRRWKVATAALAVVAAGAGVFGCLEHAQVDTLTAQLAAANDEAQQATAEETKLRSQLSDAQDRTNSQAQKLVAAEQQASTEQQQLSATERQLSTERQQLQSSRTPPPAASLEELPIRLTFHDAVFRSGKVAVLQNLSDSDLEVVLEVQSPANGAHVRRRLVVNAHSLLRFGPSQGWPFAPGQVVTLNNDKYRPLVQTVS